MPIRKDKFNLRKVKTVPRGRKVGHKGKACRRGVPVYYDELKQRISLTLTPSAISHLEKLSTQEGFSCSEFIERLLRGKVAMPVGDMPTSNS
jgi:hypothetical protein